MKREPDDDRDEPTDEEISEQIERTDCVSLIMDVMNLDDAGVVEWANALRQSIYDGISENRNDRSDGDE